MLHTYTMYYLHLISRDFAKKPVKSQLCDFQALFNAQCGNCCNLVSHIFGKNFVKVTFLLKKLLKSFNEIFFGETKFFVFPHCGTHTMEITEIYSHNVWQKFRESNVKIKGLKRFTIEV